MFRLVYFAILLFALAGCVAKIAPSPTLETSIEDFLDQLPPPPSPAVQKRLYADLLAHRYMPWRTEAPRLFREEAEWGIRWLSKKRLYAENRRPLSPKRWRRWIEACRYGDLHTLDRPAISLRSTVLRLFPTARPIFFDPTKPGEGYPFDYNQNSALYPMTPLLVSHLSRRGGWAFVQAPFAFGWVPLHDIAILDKTQADELMQLPLTAVTHDGLPVYGKRQTFLFEAKTGTLLPYSGEDDIFYHLRVASKCLGRTTFADARGAKEGLAKAPLPMTRRNVARIAYQLLGEPYGWGGMAGDRDCSAMTRDFFMPFGVWLPRNSNAQAKVGRVIDLSALPDMEKERWIVQKGVPFRTLLYLPGHIMIFVGQRKGRAYAMHNIWGVKTQKGGRYLIGRAVVTTLHLGERLPDVDKKSLLIHNIRSMNILF